MGAFAIDLGKVLTACGKVIEAAECRVPVSALAQEVTSKSKIAGFSELDIVDQESIIKGVLLASSEYDIRAGRSGGAGRKEWFKGGASSAEPQGAGAKIAKRLREERGLEREDANRIANAYLDALIGGDTGPLSDDQIVKKFSK